MGTLILSASEGPLDAASLASYLPGILDLIFCVFLLIFFISGYKKGFIKELVKLIGIFVAIAIAFSFSAGIVDLLNQNFQLSENLVGWMEGVLNSNEAFTAEASLESIEIALLSLGLPEFLCEIILPALEGISLEGQTIAQAISIALSPLLLSILVSIVVFIISFILLNLLANLLSNFLDNIPLVGFANRLLGGGLGAIKAAIYVWILLAVLSFLPLADLQGILSQTVILSWMQGNNFVLILFEQFFSVEALSQSIQEFINNAIGQ